MHPQKTDRKTNRNIPDTLAPILNIAKEIQHLLQLIMLPSASKLLFFFDRGTIKVNGVIQKLTKYVTKCVQKIQSN